MAMEQKLVVHFKSKNILKGYSHDLSMKKEIFHLIPIDSNSSKGTIEIRFSELKAVFFVKDFEGNKDYQEIKDFGHIKYQVYGKETVVLFNDGEVLTGFTQGYKANGPGFFLFPLDPGSNNIKIFVVHNSVSKVEFFG